MPASLGAFQTQCWAEATRVLMEEIVPALPVLQRSARFVSSRVESWTTDGVFVLPSLDRFALTLE